MEHLRGIKWEIENSSLAKISKKKVSITECKEYAVRDIIANLTRISDVKNEENTIKFPSGVDFHFIGRVDTDSNYSKTEFIEVMEKREFASFSVISKKNISHYLNEPFFIYDIREEDIVHIFPVDSNTSKYAKKIEDLTKYPSLWLTLDDLESITSIFELYNQITCRTKRNGNVIMPIAITAFKINDEIQHLKRIQKISKEFSIPIVIVTPEENAINYIDDLMADTEKKKRTSEIMKLLYGFEY